MKRRRGDRIEALLSVGFVAGAMLIIAFSGEPDIVDALIRYITSGDCA